MKKVFALFCTGVMLLSVLVVPAFATSSIENQVLEEVVSLYSDYYYISDANAEIISSTQNNDGSITYLINTSFSRTLKETSAYDLPFIQGLIEAKDALSDPIGIASAEQYINFWLKELEDNYIGTAQPTNATFSITCQPFNRLYAYEPAALDVIMYYDPFSGGTYSAEELRPKSNAELKAEGVGVIAEVTSSANMESMQIASAQRTYTYYRTMAISYARQWSCNSGSIDDHATCHNPSYDFIPGNDCANFVSQCLYAGGISIDGVWYPENGSSSAWYTTGNNGNGLRQYVVNSLGFYHTGIATRAVAGSIINKLTSSGSNAGHVGLVDQNDTRVSTLCAHTRCQSSAPFSTFVNYDFYTPELLSPPEM